MLYGHIVHQYCLGVRPLNQRQTEREPVGGLSWLLCHQLITQASSKLYIIYL